MTYDSIGSSSTKNNVEENLLYVIGMIDKVKARLIKIQSLIDEYMSFKTKIKSQEAEVLEYLVETSPSKDEISIKISISRSRTYVIIFMIIKQYSDDMTSK